MINVNQNVLFIATILALCIISFVHVFLFPLYNISAGHGSLKTFMDLEESLCTDSMMMRHRKLWKPQQCPHYGVVTAVQGGRLGNQMWEYASVWALARKTGLEPYIPRCIRIQLDQVFDSLTVPTFEEIAHCPIDVSTFVKSLDEWNYTHQSILLPKWIAQPDVVLTWVQDITEEFTFKKKLLDKGQQILRLAAKNVTNRVFVGMHIRRTDYIDYIRGKYSASPADIQYYYSAMRYYETKYKNVIFVVVSDDPKWCVEHFELKKNVFITSKRIQNSPALDMAVMASCNHSIIDYGTFGMWGAILAGGDTIFYNLTTHPTFRIGQMLPNWYTIS